MLKARLVVALAAMSIAGTLAAAAPAEAGPGDPAVPGATPPANDVGPVDWGEPTPGTRPRAPSAFGRTYPVKTQAARDWAFELLGHRQFGCLDRIGHFESGWRVEAWGGIPQARPPEKMRSAGAAWRTDPMVQTRWMIRYVNAKYGNPCNAWAFWQAHHWY